MKACKFCVFISLATMLVGVQAALAQFNLPREIPQIMDALKGQAEQPKPAPPCTRSGPSAIAGASGLTAGSGRDQYRRGARKQ